MQRPRRIYASRHERHEITFAVRILSDTAKALSLDGITQMSAIDDLLISRLVHQRITFDAQLVIGGVLVQRAVKLHPRRVFQGKTLSDMVSITNAFPVLPAAVEIQVVVMAFNEEIGIAARGNIHKGKVLPYIGEMLAMVGGIGKNSLIPHEVRPVHDAAVADGQSRPVKQIETWCVLETDAAPVDMITTSHHVALGVEGHVTNV